MIGWAMIGRQWLLLDLWQAVVLVSYLLYFPHQSMHPTESHHFRSESYGKMTGPGQAMNP